MTDFVGGEELKRADALFKKVNESDEGKERDLIARDFFGAVVDAVEVISDGQIWETTVVGTVIPPLGEKLPYGTSVNFMPIEKNGKDWKAVISFSASNVNPAVDGRVYLEGKVGEDGENVVDRMNYRASTLGLDQMCFAAESMVVFGVMKKNNISG